MTYLLDSPKKVLLAVADFFEQNPHRHAVGQYVLSADGNAISMDTDDETACFCVMGKFSNMRLRNQCDMRASTIAQALMKEELDGEKVTTVNDGPDGRLKIITACRIAAGKL